MSKLKRTVVYSLLLSALAMPASVFAAYHENKDKDYDKDKDKDKRQERLAIKEDPNGEEIAQRVRFGVYWGRPYWGGRGYWGRPYYYRPYYSPYRYGYYRSW
ncbi:MAG: hypothetical protein JJU12_07255 [Chlamydiales bacterium]|nr:hypothetical protein [Chlamydiales bacterium]